MDEVKPGVEAGTFLLDGCIIETKDAGIDPVVRS
jgi:hypothetical protein